MRWGIWGALLLGCGGEPDAETLATKVWDRRAPDRLDAESAWEQKRKMMRFLEDTQAVLAGLEREDWPAVEAAGGRLGNAERCAAPVPDADGITLMASDFRCRASAIEGAARQRDRAAVLRATADTLGACNACHAAYRQEVVASSTESAVD